MTELKAIIFDMDGVLIDARDWHYDALNEALSYFGAMISREEHELEFNGLPTSKKLAMLSSSGRLPRHVHSIVEEIKQERTLRIAAGRCYPVMQHLIALGWIKSSGYKVAVATNSIRATSQAMLTYAGLMPMIDSLVTNQDVERPKPDPSIYLKTCEILGVVPAEVVVFEDSDLGSAAASNAGCYVARVQGPEDVSLRRVKTEIESWGEIYDK